MIAPIAICHPLDDKCFLKKLCEITICHLMDDNRWAGFGAMGDGR